jgi:Protein of unknown function (DUF2905)
VRAVCRGLCTNLDAPDFKADKRGSFTVPRVLITIGSILVVIGLLWPWLQKLGLGRLPGDIVIERDNFRFFFPITTSIIISLIVSLVLWWLRK